MPLDPDAIRGQGRSAAPDKPEPQRLCQSCPRGNAQILLEGTWCCWACYEQRRQPDRIDQRRGEIIRQNPHWRRNPGEDRRAYNARMAGAAKALLGKLSAKQAEQRQRRRGAA
jgi:hypothetical protein